jgi:precorrin-4 methylase
LPFQPRTKPSVSLIDALKEAQEQAKINGTSNMTLEEINKIIAEVRVEARGQY